MVTVFRLPPLTDPNGYADFWYYRRRLNPIPVVSKFKTGKKGYAWTEWQTKPIPEELFKKFKAENAYADGIAVITGQVWREEHKGKYFNCIDCDNLKAIEEFCTNKDGVTVPLSEIAEKFIVEQHRDNLNKCHIYFYTEIPILAKSSDLNKLSRDEVKSGKIPLYEIKSKCNTLAFCAPSLHKDGQHYEIIGTCEPITLDAQQATELMKHIDSICTKYKLNYLANDNGNGKSTIPMETLYEEDFAIYEGNNRHEELMRFMKSIIKKNKKYDLKLSEYIIKELSQVWNQKKCKPPLDTKEFERQWKSAKNFIARMERERQQQQQQQGEEEPAAATTMTTLPEPPKIPPQFQDDYFEYLVYSQQKTVKEENALVRQIDLTMLSSHGDDPNNLGVMAPTAAGKTYPIMECVKFTPGGKEIRIVGSMSPKVLVREQGVLVDKNRNPIGLKVIELKAAIQKARSKKDYEGLQSRQAELATLLEGAAYILDLTGKTLLFLEPPHPDTWNLLKPILSHDSFEMEHPFVDNIGHGIEVKNVITRGWPACIFCSAKDESRWDIWPEIESRFMIQSPNMIKPKYKKGNQLIASRKWQPKGVKQQIIISDSDLQLGKDCFLRLKSQIKRYREKTDSPIWAPFGELLGEIFPSDKGQDNRSFNRFATMLNIITLCKAHLRYKMLYDDEELVIPSLRDLQQTMHIMQNITGLPPHKLKFYKEYIVPIWKKYDETPLQTKQICDYYNAGNPNSRLKMNSDNLRKNYLQELVNHNYLEQEQDTTTKSVKYLYTPLIFDEEEEQQAVQQQQQEESTTAPTLEQVFNNLHFSKMILPKNHKGIPGDWLKQQILQLSDRLLTSAELKILNPEGHQVGIDAFIEEYEREQKLNFFFITPRLVGDPNPVKITTSKGQAEGKNEKSTEKEGEESKKSKTMPKVGVVGDELMKCAYKAMKTNEQGDSQDYFMLKDWVFVLQMRENEQWTDDEAEYTLCRLIQEGKVLEFEPGKFRPTQKLSDSSGRVYSEGDRK